LKDGEEVDCRFSASQVFLEQKVLAVCHANIKVPHKYRSVIQYLCYKSLTREEQGAANK
jgi:hypothetical protein